MTRVLILYYSSWGHVRALAEAEAEGARSLPGTIVDVRRVPELVPDAVRQAEGYDEDPTPVAKPTDLEGYDAIIVGTPARFGLMAGQMKTFFDRLGGLWSQHALVSKVGAVFTSSGTQHGGHEAALLSTQISLLHLGMVVVGLPYSFGGQSSGEAIIGGAPYGAGTVAGGEGERLPGEIDFAGARYQGAHVARVARQLAMADLGVSQAA
ncbi:NAD(P)H:quinone oxidoreductase (plasmid) [Limimaricola variabilis]|uniref:NAD(P)H:quinone oxidoreductase n=1 Tax=Limimaricola variabilis TaxID=1492771 RepID=UPI002AC99BF2|nr:NAD(P)H:quinone oxidoreductase [Limimaricola variabilis]WPY97006.1 NAD(P)H:quinone oxidoreductase [Limimaricola variabilis]